MINCLNKSLFLLLISIFTLLNRVDAQEYEHCLTSSEYDESFVSENAFDGDVETRWASENGVAEAWISYDFNRTVTCDSITIKWEYNYAAEYQILSSDNGTDWSIIKDIESGKGGNETINNLNFSGRFIKILCKKHGASPIYSIYDIQFLDPDIALYFAAKKAEKETAERVIVDNMARDLDFEEIVFAVREPANDYIWGHWYANFAYYCLDTTYKNYGEGGRLCRYNIKTGELITVIDDPKGTIRDPQLDYSGEKILFSWRVAYSEHFHLYEVDIDGKNLKQLTFGPYADIEPTYLPDGDIIFVSSRCNRWVNCWQVPVATIYKCDGNGGNIQQLSANIEHDNTPWVLPDGRILYTRWEYIDRSQTVYHHLWSMNPDGTEQMVYFGNLNPGNVYIDAKPIPDSNSIMFSLSPGHGAKDHGGYISTLSVENGPDDTSKIKSVNKSRLFVDPYPISKSRTLAANSNKLFLFDSEGVGYKLFTLDSTFGDVSIHEPRPVKSRKREPIIPSRTDLTKATGELIVNDIYMGRNLKGVERGEIKELLILEALPKPVQFTGSMEPLTWGGSFTLESIIGTVPVESDGSVYMELPSNRSFLFVALDKDGSSVKRMQSFVSVVPGEVTSCVGCHEERASTPVKLSSNKLMALQRDPSKPKRVEDIPEIFEFPRDIQPILDKHCVECHNPDNYNGGVLLTGDHGPIYSHSYSTLKVRGEYRMGRNRAKSNYDPRAIGDGASTIMGRLSGDHHGVTLSDLEIKKVRYWINTGATYPGTYAALGTGSIGLNEGHLITDHSDLELPEVVAMKSVIEKRCISCHKDETRLATYPSEVLIEAWVIEDKTWDTNFMRDIIYNLSRPEKSLVLMAPLSEEAGGHKDHKVIFKNRRDADYITILEGVKATTDLLNSIKRFDMDGFKPRAEYIREMKKFGILPDSFNIEEESLDIYKTDQNYWESLRYYPKEEDRPHLYKNRYPTSVNGFKRAIESAGDAKSFIAADYGAKKIREFNIDGNIIWEHEGGSCTDVTKFENGNVLFATGREVIEVTKGHMEIFKYISKGEVYSCQRLESGNTLIAESEPLRLVEVTPKGDIVKEIALKSDNKDKHWSVRHVRKGVDGTYLVGHLGDSTVREYNDRGDTLNEFKAPGYTFMGQRLKNGNTLISWQKGVIEYNSEGESVWELNEEDVPDMNIKFVLGVNRLDNGNTLICNWLGWGEKGNGTPLFEVTKEKSVVWSVPDSEEIGSFTYIEQL